jgi:hypothetical protein
LCNVVASPLAWTNTDAYDTAFQSADMAYIDGRFQVPEEGHYFIYSAITFEFPAENGEVTTVYHNIIRQHRLLPNTGQQILLMNKYGGGSGQGGQIYTSFLCGVLHLRRQDEISVKVSNPNLIYKFTFTNYLGLYKI